MTDQTTTETTGTRGPVQPAEPDLSALGGGRRNRRAARIAAAAQQGGAPGDIPPALAGGNAPVNSANAGASTTTVADQVPAQQGAAPSSGAAEPKAAPAPSQGVVEQTAATPTRAGAPDTEPSEATGPSTAVVAEDAATQVEAAEQPSEQQERSAGSKASAPTEAPKTAGPATATDDTVTGERAPAAGDSSPIGSEKAAELDADGRKADGTSSLVVTTDPVGAAGTDNSEKTGQVKASPAEGSPADTHLDVEVDDDLDDEDDDLDDEDFTAGKRTQQSWVPDDVADKFQRMQATGHGRTAELIVLTAVRDCADRLPEIIKAARGPVHEDGLFAGLPVLDRKPGRQPKPKPNSSRIQYQVSLKYLPDLKRIARKHKLKLSVLVRLALGDYFGVPVRLGRTKR